MLGLPFSWKEEGAEALVQLEAQLELRDVSAVICGEAGELLMEIRSARY